MLVVSELIWLLEPGWISRKQGLSSLTDFYVYGLFQCGKRIIRTCHYPSLYCFMSVRSTSNSCCTVCRVDTCLLGVFSTSLFYYVRTIIWYAWNGILCPVEHVFMINYIEFRISLFNRPPTIHHYVSNGLTIPHLF